MKILKGKLIIGAIVSLAFFSTAVFGLLQFEHKNGAPMVNCPYAQNGSSLCENILEHVNNWRQFSSALISSFAVLLFALGMFLYPIPDILNADLGLNGHRYYFHNKKSSKYWSDIVNWLALFENSPSLSYTRRR